MIGRADVWIRRTTIGCVALLASIAGTVSYLHMHTLVVATPVRADGVRPAAAPLQASDATKANTARGHGTIFAVQQGDQHVHITDGMPGTTP